MSNSHQIGLIIRSCRESRGISQDYMADMLNIVQSSYAGLESGKTSLTIDRLVRITEILELDIHRVIEESKIIHPPGLVHFAQQPIAKSIDIDTREVYDQLIAELRNEVEFLRSLIRKE